MRTNNKATFDVAEIYDANKYHWMQTDLESAIAAQSQAFNQVA